jgi:preprotein translocase subunit SecA
MTLLREAVGWRGYGQRNPLYEYKQDAFYMFETREELLRHLVIYDLIKIINFINKIKIKLIIMTKRTLSNKGRYSVLKVSGFRARMATPQGRKTFEIDVKKVEKI